MITEIEHSKATIANLLTLQDRSITLLKRTLPNLGMTDQEAISEHLAELEGTRYNPKDWDMSDKNGEQ